MKIALPVNICTPNALSSGNRAFSTTSNPLDELVRGRTSKDSKIFGRKRATIWSTKCATAAAVEVTLRKILIGVHQSSQTLFLEVNWMRSWIRRKRRRIALIRSLLWAWHPHRRQLEVKWNYQPALLIKQIICSISNCQCPHPNPQSVDVLEVSHRAMAHHHQHHLAMTTWALYQCHRFNRISVSSPRRDTLSKLNFIPNEFGEFFISFFFFEVSNCWEVKGKMNMFLDETGKC